MPWLQDTIERLRALPRAAHVVLLLATIWVPIALFWFDHPVWAGVVMLIGAGTFMLIYPMRAQQPGPAEQHDAGDTERSDEAANDA